jgi:hypothetical protein
MLDRMVRRLGLTTLVVLFAGCDDPGVLPDGHTSLCEGGSVPWVKHIVGSPPFDSMEIRDARKGAAETRDKIGTPCEKATDRPACDAAYAGVDLKANGDVAFVATRGNDVIVKNVAQLDAAILGTIDNAHEAAVRGIGGRERAPMACSDDEQIGAKKVARGFEVASITKDKCTGKKTRVITAVDTDGTIRELETQSLEEGEKKVCD